MILTDTSPTNGPEFTESLDREVHARGATTWFPAAAAALQAIFTRRLTKDEANALTPEIASVDLAFGPP